MTREDAGLSETDLNRLPLLFGALLEAWDESARRGCGCVELAMSKEYARDEWVLIERDVFGQIPETVLADELRAGQRTLRAVVGVLARVRGDHLERAVAQYLRETGDGHGPR